MQHTLGRKVDFNSYMENEAQMIEVLKRQYEEEKKRFELNHDPEVQAFDQRVGRQKMALNQDIGGYKPDTKTDPFGTQ